MPVAALSRHVPAVKGFVGRTRFAPPMRARHYVPSSEVATIKWSPRRDDYEARRTAGDGQSKASAGGLPSSAALVAIQKDATRPRGPLIALERRRTYCPGNLGFALVDPSGCCAPSTARRASKTRGDSSPGGSRLLASSSLARHRSHSARSQAPKAWSRNFEASRAGLRPCPTGLSSRLRTNTIARAAATATPPVHATGPRILRRRGMALALALPEDNGAPGAAGALLIASCGSTPALRSSSSRSASLIFAISRISSSRACCSRTDRISSGLRRAITHRPRRRQALRGSFQASSFGAFARRKSLRSST